MCLFIYDVNKFRDISVPVFHGINNDFIYLYTLLCKVLKCNKDNELVENEMMNLNEKCCILYGWYPDIINQHFNKVQLYAKKRCHCVGCFSFLFFSYVIFSGQFLYIHEVRLLFLKRVSLLAQNIHHVFQHVTTKIKLFVFWDSHKHGKLHLVQPVL